MNTPALIPVQQSVVNSQQIQTVNARDLYAFLEVPTRFNDWITNRIKDFDFVQNQDFVTFTENLVKGRPRVEYALTLDMAKELSMVERNAKGKEARQYFIECERQAKVPQDPIIMIRMEQLAMQKQLSVMAHKIEDVALDRDILFNELDATRKHVMALENRTPKLTLGVVTNPITLRLHTRTGLTIRQWAEKHGFEYSQVRNVISGLSQKATIMRALEADTLLLNDLF